MKKTIPVFIRMMPSNETAWAGFPPSLVQVVRNISRITSKPWARTNDSDGVQKDGTQTVPGDTRGDCGVGKMDVLAFDEQETWSAILHDADAASVGDLFNPQPASNVGI